MVNLLYLLIISQSTDTTIGHQNINDGLKSQSLVWFQIHIVNLCKLGSGCYAFQVFLKSFTDIAYIFQNNHCLKKLLLFNKECCRPFILIHEIHGLSFYVNNSLHVNTWINNLGSTSIWPLIFYFLKFLNFEIF